jgi:hypothetical protein
MQMSNLTSPDILYFSTVYFLFMYSLPSHVQLTLKDLKLTF